MAETYSTRTITTICLLLSHQMAIMLIMTMSVFASAVTGLLQKDCLSTSCTCHDTELIDCRSGSITVVPQFQHTNTTYDKLRFENTNIERIRSSAFTGIRFRKLEIKDNPLKAIHAAAFVGLETTLTEVELEFDRFGAEFPREALQILTNLTVLKIKRGTQAQLPAGALYGLQTLRELRLKDGHLAILTAVDVESQRSALEILDISNNQLREFPTEAIQRLARLKVLNARENLFNHLGGSFVVSSTLEELDISSHELTNKGINISAFVGVAPTLRRLVMSRCSLSDEHAAAITRAAGVTHLEVPFNQLTRVRAFLADMPNLEQLNAQNNIVNELTTVSLPSTRTLRTLDLAYNPLTDIDPDAFVNLQSLEDLKLDHAPAVMSLNSRSFASQRRTLSNLSLNGVDLSRPQWSIIDGLERLTMVHLSRCRLENIPPFTFRKTGGRLHTLDLSYNHIDQLNQSCLTGLESSLSLLNLRDNRLTTFSRCTFHRFAQLDAKSLNLNDNSLQCDCRLQWLYNWTGTFKRQSFWRCAGGKRFYQLTDDDFQHCNASEDDEPCEDFILTTPSSSTRPLLAVFVVNTTSTSFAVRWTVDSATLPLNTAGFRVNCSCAESSSAVDIAVREHRFDGLYSSSSYRVCVTLEYMETVGNSTDSMEEVSCLNITTASWLRNPVVISVVIIAAFLVVALSLIVGILLAVRKWRQRRCMRLAELAQPKIAAGKTKRFMRLQQQQQRPHSLEASANDRLVTDARRYQSRSVETNLDTLQDDDDGDRYKTLLALRLLQSRNTRSLDNLVDAGNGAASSSYIMNQLYGFREKDEQEVYDEIDDGQVSSPLMSEHNNV